MIGQLSSALKTLLQSQDRADSVRDAEVVFEPPVEAYNPPAPTISLFLYDVREDVHLRSNVPEWDRASAEMRRPAFRVVCSYLVTVWSGSTHAPGDPTFLAEHNLLGDVASVFAGNPQIILSGQPFPVPLSLSQLDPGASSGQFWAALGGKLRPALTLSATLALVPDARPITAHPVSTATTVLNLMTTQNVLNVMTAHNIGGTVRDQTTGKALQDVALEVLELGVTGKSDADGRFVLSIATGGSFRLQATRPGYTTVTRSITVPGTSPTAFDITLNAIP